MMAESYGFALLFRSPLCLPPVHDIGCNLGCCQVNFRMVTYNVQPKRSTVFIILSCLYFCVVYIAACISNWIVQIRYFMKLLIHENFVSLVLYEIHVILLCCIHGMTV
ncbi:hypothetical protein VPH35_044462 [Triticum aestivum]